MQVPEQERFQPVRSFEPDFRRLLGLGLLFAVFAGIFWQYALDFDYVFTGRRVNNLNSLHPTVRFFLVASLASLFTFGAIFQTRVAFWRFVGRITEDGLVLPVLFRRDLHILWEQLTNVEFTSGSTKIFFRVSTEAPVRCMMMLPSSTPPEEMRALMRCYRPDLFSEDEPVRLAEDAVPLEQDGISSKGWTGLP